MLHAFIHVVHVIEPVHIRIFTMLPTVKDEVGLFLDQGLPFPCSFICRKIWLPRF